MRLVVDASVIVQVSIAGGALGPLAGHELLAPPLLISEVTSSLSELTYRGDIPPDRGRAYVERLSALPITIERPADLAILAWDLARSLGWAKTYDAEYIALAVSQNAAMVTLDARLGRAAGHLVEILAPIAIPRTKRGR